MPVFPSNPYRSPSSKQGGVARLIPWVRRRPFLLFGVPFTVTIVGAAYGLSYLTQTRYDYNATKVSSLSKEEELGMKKDRRRIDLREEYFKLSQGPGGGGVGGSSSSDDAWEDWEPKRVPRPEGTSEWGVPGSSGSYVEEAGNVRNYDKGKRRGSGNIEAEAADPEPSSSISSPVGAASRGNRTVITSSGQRLVIGPDGKPCRSCSSKLAFAEAMRGAGTGGGSNAKSSLPTSSSSSSASPSSTAPIPAAAAVAATAASTGASDCPPDVEELGRSTWDFLHSVAAVYPESPSKEQRAALLSLLTSLPILYPCGACAEALTEDYQRRESSSLASSTSTLASPAPDSMTRQQATTDKDSAVRFMCSIHNDVNRRLGKKVWDCDDLAELKRRWEDSGERCY
ncbi:unnamed protein product [Jaminaea pallidilutea]